MSIGWGKAVGIGFKGFRFWRKHEIGKRILGTKPKEQTSEGIEVETGDDDMKLLEAIGNLRTSTKGGAAAALVPAAVMLLPFAEPVNDYIMQACQAEGGPLPFLAGAGLTWFVYWVVARKSKTPEKPGVL